jgi:hypothetical protein
VKLSRASIRYLLIYQGIVPFFINALITFGLSLPALRSGSPEQMPVWKGTPSAFSDVIGTLFLLPFITCLIATPLVRRDVRRSVTAAVPKEFLPLWLRCMTVKHPLRALLFGIASLAVMTGPALLVLQLSGQDNVDVQEFVLCKILFAAIYGFLVTPLIALSALTDPVAPGT